MFAFTINAQSQEINIDSIIDENPVLRTAYYSETLTLKDKITVVNQQVEEGVISKETAYAFITKISEIDEVVTEDNVENSWTDALNPFKEAMEVQIDTIPQYNTQVRPYLYYGLGNLATDGAFANSEFGYLRSSLVEWGLAFRKPFSKTDNKWGIRYGLGFKYQGLATTANKEFVLNADQTQTAISNHSLRKNYAFLRNTYITIPLSLDFTTTTKVYNDANKRFVVKEGFNFGIGGYLSYNLNSKQHIRYTNTQDVKIYEQQKHNWNVTDFQYGLTTYVGTDNFKLVAKYDLSTQFENNPINQNYWSLGVQLGL